MTLKQRRTDAILSETIDKLNHLQINEEIDKNTINAAINAIQRLNAMDLRKIPVFDLARDEAASQATDAIAGVDDRSLTRKFVDLFREKRSPFLDALTFASALRSFFPILSKYVTVIMNKTGGPEVDHDVPLNVVVGNLEGSEGKVMTRLAAGLRAIIKKGLKPDGKFSDLGNDWRKKFVNASDDEIADQIMELSINDIEDITRSVVVATGPQPNRKLLDKLISSRPSQTNNPPSEPPVQKPEEPKQNTHASLSDIVDTIKTRLGNDVSTTNIRKIVDIIDNVYGVNR